MIQLRALGVLDLRNSEGQELRQVLAQPKRAALLTFLAVATRGGSHPRDKLLALFWPDQVPEQARNALSQAVHFLRRALGDDVIVSQNGDALGVAPSLIWCDAIAFDDAIKQGREEEALELYRGDFLEGFHVANAPDFERWLDSERQRLGKRFDAALETMATRSEQQGDYAGALTVRRRLAARAPYNSAVALKLMRALAASGDPAAAVQHAQIHEKLLRAELEVAPPADITAFVAELQARPPALSVAPRPASESSVETNPRAPVAERRFGKTSRRVAAIAAGLTMLTIAAAGAAIATNGRGSVDPKQLRSIAVLPFDDWSTDSTRRFFADGLHDAVITELARYPELSVRARTSVVQYIHYRKTNKRIREIARELGVDAIIEGSTQREGNRVLVTAQLIHGPSDTHLWADHFERELSDGFTLQLDIADAIAKQVRVAARPREETRVVARPAGREMFLRELVLLAKNAEIARTTGAIQKAKYLYERAVREDSSFALGVAALSNIHTVIARYGYGDPHAARDTARLLALRAVQLDSSLSDARAALASSLADRFQFSAADSQFRAAIHLSPSNAQARMWYAMFLAAMGRGREALHEINESRRLDPLGSRAHIIILAAAEYLVTGKRPTFDETDRRWREFLAREPDEPWAHRGYAYELAEAGRCDDARREIAYTARLAPSNVQTHVALAKIEWWCGDRAKAHTMLERVKRDPRAVTNGKFIAFAHATWGERDSTFVWLNRTEWGYGSLMDLRVIRFMDGLRDDPEYHKLLRKLGLPPDSSR